MHQLIFALPLAILLLSSTAVLGQAVPVPVPVPANGSPTASAPAAATAPIPQQYSVQGAPQAQGMQFGMGSGRMAAAAGPPNQQIINRLQDLLNNQAAMGQFPSNNAFLADIDQLIQNHTSVPKSQIKVVNSGPGVLKISFANGTTTDVKPNFMMDIDVGKDEIQLEAKFQNVSVSFEHLANGPAKFWDQDDRRDNILQANNFGGIVQPHLATLTPGVRGHHLHQ